MVNALQILIIEDDPIIAKDIESLLLDAQYNVVGIADNYQSAIDLFNRYPPDIALVDIQLQGEKDGVDVANTFNSIRRIPIIYLTAQSDAYSVTKAKQSAPSAYMLKPFDERSLHINIELAVNSFYSDKILKEGDEQTTSSDKIKLNAEVILSHEKCLFVKQNYRFVKINEADICWIEADHNHTYIHTLSSKFILRTSLSKLLERIQFDTLVRVHRSFAVNILHIESISEEEIVVKKDKFIPLGNAYKEGFLKKFTIL